MNVDHISPPDEMGLPPRRFAMRRANLVEAIRQASTRRRTLPGHLAQLRRRPVVLAVALVSLVATAGSAIALTATDFLSEQERVDRYLWTPPALNRVGPRVEISRGADWSFMAWGSATGVCVAYAAGEATSWVRACGVEPERADRDPRTPNYLIASALIPTQDAYGGTGAVFGGVTPEVARVELELPDGRVLSAPTLPGTRLDTRARFFIIRETHLSREQMPVRLSAYAANGERLERRELGG